MYLHVGRLMSERDVVECSSMGVAVKGDSAQLFSESQKELFPAEKLCVKILDPLGKKSNNWTIAQ